MRIALLCPTWNRPDMCLRMIESVRKTEQHHIYCQIYLGVNADDPKHDEYMNLADDHQYIFPVQCPEGMRVGAIWNKLHQFALVHDVCESPGIFMLANDDLVFHTPGWDQHIVAAFEEDPLQCVWCDDRINGEKHCAFPFVTQKWIDVVGHYVPEVFNFFRHDTWIYDIAIMANAQRYLGNAVIEHKHWSVTGEKDETTIKNRQANENARDLKIWNETQQQRTDAAARIIDARQAAEKTSSQIG